MGDGVVQTDLVFHNCPNEPCGAFSIAELSCDEDPTLYVFTACEQMGDGGSVIWDSCANGLAQCTHYNDTACTTDPGTCVSADDACVECDVKFSTAATHFKGLMLAGLMATMAVSVFVV